MLRTSSYTIYVDLPGSENEMLLVHGYTGAYDLVNRRVATYLRSLEAKKAPRPLYGRWSPEPPVEGEIVSPSEEAIEALKERGYLTEMSIEDEKTHLTEAVNKLHYLRALRQPLYIFMPTYNCNLRCFYCFQDHMRTNPAFSHLLRTMDRPLIDRLFKAMPKIEALHGIAEGDERERNIGFFGGEPLLEENQPIIEYIMTKALSEGSASFWAVTNGTDLHAYRDLLGPDKIAHIQITLDGTPEEHDRRRIYADGSGSFERIARNLTMALDLGVEVQVRVNVDCNNIKQLPEIARVAIERRWDQYKNFDLHTAPINAHNEKTDEKTTMSTWELGEAMKELRQEYNEMRVYRLPDAGMKSRARQIFTHQLDPTPGFKTGFCSAHDRMYIFDVFADIYACWDRTGDPEIRIGSVNEEGEIKSNPKVLQMWRSRTAASNPVCQKCRYLLHCGGGCAVLAENSHGVFFGNFCDDFGKRFRASVAEAFIEHALGVQAEELAESVCDQ
ncbi:MAG TPA: radical SAM protein [Pyrinomonadaceae bacterium]|nr:radical SAM protein [Pyrinomonadaceae bacterium]